jgi:hypothetical protein
MHTEDFSQLMSGALAEAMKQNKGMKPTVNKDVLNEMRTIEESNNKHLEKKELPNEMRTPTDKELLIMRNFAIEYKRANKNASKREIRRATQKQFNIRIYR